MPQINLRVYGLFSYVVGFLGILTIVNFFISDYASLVNRIIKFFNGNYLIPLSWTIALIIFMNLIRHHILSKLLYAAKSGE